MTPLFCVDITENRNNDRINGCDTELLVQKTSDLLSSSRDRLLERAETVEGHARMPAFLVLIWYLCGILALLIVLVVVKNLSTLSLARMFLNAPWMFFACPICAVVWLVLTLLARRREKAVLGSEEAARTASRLESSQKAIFDELGIPADAAAVDVLFSAMSSGTVRSGPRSWRSPPHIWWRRCSCLRMQSGCIWRTSAANVPFPAAACGPSAR